MSNKAVMKKEATENLKIRDEIMRCSIEPDCCDTWETITKRMLHDDQSTSN